MKKGFYLLMLFLISVNWQLNAQGRVLRFNKCGDNGSYSVLKKDTIIIECDKAIILNDFKYKEIALSAQSFASRVPQWNELIFNYEKKIIHLNKIDSLNQYYIKELRSKFDSLANASTKVSDSTVQKLTKVNNTLTTIDKNIAEAKLNIANAQQIIRNDERKKWLVKLGFGAGGLVLGVGIGAIFMVIDK